MGQLEKAVNDQQKQTTDLAQAIYLLQEATVTTTYVLSTLQVLQNLKAQIKLTTRELHSGIHPNLIPVSLFHPEDIKHSWNEFNKFKNKMNLSPIFEDRPTQLYEFSADYFQINGSIHILTKIPLKNVPHSFYDLQKAKPALLRLKNSLMYYEDQDLIAVPQNPANNPTSISLNQNEQKECNRLATID